MNIPHLSQSYWLAIPSLRILFGLNVPFNWFNWSGTLMTGPTRSIPIRWQFVTLVFMFSLFLFITVILPSCSIFWTILKIRAVCRAVNVHELTVFFVVVWFLFWSLSPPNLQPGLGRPFSALVALQTWETRGITCALRPCRWWTLLIYICRTQSHLHPLSNQQL